MNDYKQELIEDFYAAANMLSQIKYKDVHFDGLPVINTSALHLLETIAAHPKSNTTEIAELIGVTKGAVSQQTKKLEAKGLIQRYNIENNDKEVFFSLTDDGSKLYEAHAVMHQELYDNLQRLTDGLSTQDIEKIHNYLRSIKSYMDIYADKL